MKGEKITELQRAPRLSYESSVGLILTSTPERKRMPAMREPNSYYRSSFLPSRNRRARRKIFKILNSTACRERLPSAASALPAVSSFSVGLASCLIRVRTSCLLRIHCIHLRAVLACHSLERTLPVWLQRR